MAEWALCGHPCPPLLLHGGHCGKEQRSPLLARPATLWDTLPPQVPQTGPSGLLPCAHWPLPAASGHVPAVGDSGTVERPGLVHGQSHLCMPVGQREHPTPAAAEYPLNPGHPPHPWDPLPRRKACCRLSGAGWGCLRWGGGCAVRAELSPPVPPRCADSAVARAVQKALCSAISHAASEHAARLFPGEQRRQLLPSCSTSLPHRLLDPDEGRETEDPPGPDGPRTPVPRKESPPKAGEQ